MTPEENSVIDTRIIWNTFSEMGSERLIILLSVARISTTGFDRKQMIRNCVMNWFDGDVPNFVELDRLTNE